MEGTYKEFNKYTNLVCNKASARDIELYKTASTEYRLIILKDKCEQKPMINDLAPSTKAKNTMAHNYNKSKSRAVRLSRASKTAKKSSCWH